MLNIISFTRAITHDTQDIHKKKIHRDLHLIYVTDAGTWSDVI